MFNYTLNKGIAYTLFGVGIILLVVSIVNLIFAFEAEETEYMVASIASALYGIVGGCVSIVFAKLSCLLDHYLGIKSADEQYEDSINNIVDNSDNE